MPRTSVGTEGFGIEPLTQLALAATKKVPAVKYAFGLAGIAACGAIIALIIGPTQGGVILLALTFLGAILLFVFASLAGSSKTEVYVAGLVMVWAVVSFFTFFLVITTTAFVKAWPLPWAEFLGISPIEEAALCQQRVATLWLQSNNSDVQYGDALQTAEDIKNCDPLRYHKVKGAIAFYTGDYFGAVKEFEAAHELAAADDPTTRDLGDSYVEVGRLDDALKIYERMTNKNSLWTYKIARVKFYQGSVDDALSMAKTVPSDLVDDGNLLGRARILEAAILVEQAKQHGQTSDPGALNEAYEQFVQGIEMDRAQWSQIFQATQRTKYESFKKQYEVLKPYLAGWLKRLDSL